MLTSFNREGQSAVTVYSAAELFEACGVLFGPEISPSIAFLHYLQPAGIKEAYWRRALETHPDRAKTLGEQEAVLAERFKAVTRAYERLTAAVRGEGRLIIRQDPVDTPPTAPPTGKAFQDRYFRGTLPRWELLIGQYLYYCGLISWGTLIEAITSQRRQRPLIGQIALDWGWLTPRDVSQILRQRNAMEKFGDCALRRGYITPFNLKTLLFRQRALQRPLGHYLRKHGFTEALLDRLAAEQRRHNQEVARGRSK